MLQPAVNSVQNKSPRGTGQSTLNALNKFTSQIKKPPHRKSSPINWFPRKKVDSYLKRKIKMLQEKDGMNLTLDETLGDSNPHYSRVLREKIAAREAAHTAMEARKAALVEASWCRILRAARIQSKEAEALLLKAEETAAEAFEAATALGVIMYDMPNCPRKPSRIETSTANGGRSTTHTVTASFETEFDVDKEVAAAVKTAFIRLASCPSFDKDEFKELFCKIRQNPDIVFDNNQELSDFSSSEDESDSGPEHETDVDCKLPTLDTRQRKKIRQSIEKPNIVDMMLERLRCLKEDELSSLATIVATCGLNAALAEVESSKLHDQDSSADYTSSFKMPRRMSSVCAGTIRYSNLEQIRKKQFESELPSLDKFLVKHMSKLEREVQEAKNSKKNGSFEGNPKNDKIDYENSIPDLGIILVKHSSKFEKEIEEAKKNSRKDFEIVPKKPASDLTSSESIPDLGSILIKHSSKLEKEVEEIRGKSEKAVNRVFSQRKDVPEVPSLDKFLVKHVSRLEREVQEAKTNSSDRDIAEKENVDSNKAQDRKSKMDKKVGNNETGDSLSLDKILVKPVHRLEREKMQALSLRGNQKHQNKNAGNTATHCESLDKVLVKHVSRLEKEKMEFSLKEEEVKREKTSCRNVHMQMNKEGGLDQVLVKHKSKLEREKIPALSSQQGENQRGLSVSRREARDRELQETWGGLSLGNSIKPHLSKLEKDKAAWIKAEEEERKRCAIGEGM
ncbi:uncharacterized protein LOC105650754 isoform X2 [Jatropha curcas]|uniref:uncharacterized protein LOC105650754 isoform X2 n=1 Tax=Jatropha curcas TaxID=180498 RepID=UPI0009D741C4|nr:uncharacterized protein LOC105650754 isoform X2 [Jatropha curcas]